MSFLLAVVSPTYFNYFKVLNLFIALLLSSFNTDSSVGQEETGQMTKCQIAIARIHKGLQSVKNRILDHCGKTMKRRLKTTAKKKTLVKISAKDIEENNYAMTDVRKDIHNICVDIGYYNTEESSSRTRKYEEFLTSRSTCVPIAVAETYSDEGDDAHSVCTGIEYRKQVRNMNIGKIIVTHICKYNLEDSTVNVIPSVISAILLSLFF